MENFGLLTAEICWLVWGTSANFNLFCVLPSLLHRRRSPEANQTVRDVWPSPGLVHYRYIFGSSCPLTEFCSVQNSLYVQILSSPVLAALLRGMPAAGVSQTLRRGIQGMELRNFRRGRHLYSAGRPSRWASAHILVMAALWLLSSSLSPPCVIYFCPVVSIFFLLSLSIYWTCVGVIGLLERTYLLCVYCEQWEIIILLYNNNNNIIEKSTITSLPAHNT